MHAITLLQNYDRVAAMYVSVLLPYEFTLLQNVKLIHCRTASVLLPYEFTLLQNLKRGLKLLPVYVSQGFQLHFITSPFSLSRKNHINCHNVQERSERLCEISLKEYSKVAFLWFLLILYQNHPKTRSCPGERNHFG